MPSYASCTSINPVFNEILLARLNSCCRRATNIVLAVDRFRRTPLHSAEGISVFSQSLASMSVMILAITPPAFAKRCVAIVTILGISSFV